MQKNEYKQPYRMYSTLSQKKNLPIYGDIEDINFPQKKKRRVGKLTHGRAQDQKHIYKMDQNVKVNNSKSD